MSAGPRRTARPSRSRARDPTTVDAPRGARLIRAALPILAVVVFVAIAGFSIWAGSLSGTLGYDFLAYHQAANRVLAGERLYDPSVEQTGGFGLFYYPPPFVLAILPLAPLAPAVATWVWVGLSIAALLGAIALMPVGGVVRWLVLLLAGPSWPVVYALKLGQVGPLLLLLFVIGWRWLDDARAVGASAAAGAIVKIQPGIVLVWALLTRRWGAVAVGAAILLIAAVLATIVTGGPGVWADYVALLRNVSDPVSTPHNFTPGAVVYQLGVPTGVAATVQLASSVAAVGLVAVAAFRATAAASYLAAVVASQLLSPVLWDHYAMLLLLPVAWLLERRQFWAIAIPLATTALTIDLTPPAAYPLAFWVALVAVVAVGIRERNDIAEPRR